MRGGGAARRGPPCSTIRECPALLLLVFATVARGQMRGADECPCITSASAQFAGLAAAATAKGLPANYGQAGCQAYDQGLEVAAAGVRCKENAEPYCQRSWCYVDKELCAENTTACAAAGGTLGSHAHASCRSRDSSQTAMFKGSALHGDLRYSYATCGELDTFQLSGVARIAGRTLQAAMRDSSELAPFTYPSSPMAVDPKRPHLIGYKGLLLDLVDDFLALPPPPLPHAVLNLSTEFGSETSRAKYPGSTYTACAYDVVLGKRDICIADFWMTSERIALGIQFLRPPFGSDDMYLIALRQEAAEGFATLLAKPFSPFAPALWAFIILYIFLSALVTAITDMANEEDFENQSSYVARYLKSLYLNFLGYLTGGPANTPQSVPARIGTMGFGFFTMIVLTSYTANLASLLVAQASRNTIASIDDAIAANLRICIMAAIHPEFEALYPRARFVNSADEHELLAMAHPGEGQACEAFITTAISWERAQAGLFAKQDCEMEEAGGAKYQGRKLCMKTQEGDVDLARDCRVFGKVRNVLSL